MRTSSLRLVTSTLAVLPLAASCALRTSAPPTRAHVAERLNRLAVPFVENAGQGDPRVAYYAPTFSGTVFVTGEGELVYALPAPQPRAEAADLREPASGWTLTESFVDGHPTPVGAHSAATHLSVFVGDDPTRWQPDVATYADVDLGAVWPGISVTLTAYGSQMEKVFTVEPGAVPDTIRVRVAGAEALAVVADGGLVVHTGVGDVRLTPPVAYQEIAGTRRMVPAAYVIAGDEYGFRVRGYDPTRPVVIDPLLQATNLGGSDIDEAFALAIAPTTGDVYVAGLTNSINFPGTAAGAQRVFGGVTDTFVTRLNASLTALEWATYLGGSGDDEGIALAIAPTTGDVYVAGLTDSRNFPGTSGGAQSVLRGPRDAFVARLNASLTALEQATYLGGRGVDTAVALAIAPATGDVYVAGATVSTDLPGTQGGAQPTFGGVIDAYVAQLNAGLTALEQATYLGGTAIDDALALAVAPTTGDVYVAGVADSTNLPGTVGGAQSAKGGSLDAFVARLNGSLTALEQATYLGGSGDDQAEALAIEPTTGDVYVTGDTFSRDFPGTSGGAQSALGGSVDGFVARLSADLTTLDQATYLGGLGEDSALAIQPTTTDVYVAGFTVDINFPGTAGGAQSAFGGNGDGFVARLNTDLTALDEATFLGGSDVDAALAVAIAPTTGDVYVAGLTASPSFPGTAGGAQNVFGGAQDAFVARLSADLSATPTTTTTTSTTTSTTTFPSTTTTTTIPDNTCPVGKVFWKNHPSAWPVATLTLGSQTYTQSELSTLLRLPTVHKGADASLIVAHQLIAAKLSIANGSDPTTIAPTVADADRLLAAFAGGLPYGVAQSSVQGQSMVSDGQFLRRFNSRRQTPTCIRSFHHGRFRRSARGALSR